MTVKRRGYQIWDKGRGFSDWVPVCQFEECCKCGATHEAQYRIVERKGLDCIEMRMRQAQARTKTASKKMKYIHSFGSKQLLDVLKSRVRS